MARTLSPLRYPGGKTVIAPLVSDIIKINDLTEHEYIEPFAGGAGLALFLLENELVKKVHLNDFDRSIWAFWKAVFFYTNKLIDLIEKTDVTISEWQRQKKIQENKQTADIVELGFSTFFLNRTNRSGIIAKAGMIGGHKQLGLYKIDCRYNKKNLIEKILNISKFKRQINLYNKDANKLINLLEKKIKDSFYFIDPPYYEKGRLLYSEYFLPNDHIDLANSIQNIKGNWLLTYDFTEKIKCLYKQQLAHTFSLNYSAAKKRKEVELLYASNGLILPVKKFGLSQI